jgi:hypothetical protein
MRLHTLRGYQMFGDEIRELLLSLPIGEVTLSVFAAACAIGGVCTLVRAAVRSVPGVLSELHVWWLDRSTLDSQPAWVKQDAPVPIRRDPR